MAQTITLAIVKCALGMIRNEISGSNAIAVNSVVVEASKHHCCLVGKEEEKNNVFRVRFVSICSLFGSHRSIFAHCT